MRERNSFGGFSVVRFNKNKKQLVVSNGVETFTLDNIDKRITDLELLYEISPDFKTMVDTLIGNQKFIEKKSHSYEVDKVNFENEVKDFIQIQTSIHTKTTYGFCIKRFLKWCNDNKINPKKLTNREVVFYSNFLKGELKLSINTTRFNMGCLSGFYKFLMIRNPKLFPVSPFAGYKYDKSELVRKQDFVSKKDIEVLLEKLKKINRMDAYICIQLLSKYGLRIGVFQKMVVNEKNGQWKSISKGSKLKGKFTIEETKKLLKSGLLDKKSSTLSILIKRQTGLLFEKGKISCPFSPHDLRHFVITKKLNECGGNFEKMFGVSRQFHKNFSTTMGYYNYREQSIDTDNESIIDDDFDTLIKIKEVKNNEVSQFNTLWLKIENELNTILLDIETNNKK